MEISRLGRTAKLFTRRKHTVSCVFIGMSTTRSMNVHGYPGIQNTLHSNLFFCVAEKGTYFP